MSSWIYMFAISVYASAGMGTAPLHARSTSQDTVTGRLYSVGRHEGSGELITLKSGKSIRGVRLLRQTPHAIELEVHPGVEPLVLPAKQVVSIQHGEQDLLFNVGAPDRDVDAAPNSGQDLDVLAAVKVSPELLKKMAGPVSAETIAFNEQDVLTILQTISMLSRVTISIEPALETISADIRRTNMTLQEGASLDSFLREEVARETPWLRVEFRYDRLHISARNQSDLTGAAPPDPKKKSSADNPQNSVR